MADKFQVWMKEDRTQLMYARIPDGYDTDGTATSPSAPPLNWTRVEMLAGGVSATPQLTGPPDEDWFRAVDPLEVP